MNNQEEIDGLIARYLAGDALPEEAILLEEWKAADAANDHYFKQCEKLFGINTSIYYTSDEIDETWKNLQSIIQKQKAKPKVIPLHFKWAVAAALIIGTFLVIKFVMNNRSSTDAVVAYQSGSKVRNIDLSDHSQIFLEPHSEIIVSAGFGKSNRHLKLKGNATFSVKHHDNQPFIVDLTQLYVKDIGTIFSLRSSSDDDTVFVKVKEGVVLLFDSLGTDITIKAGQESVYLRSAKRILKSPESIAPIKLEFVNESLTSIALELTKQYKTPVVISDTIIGNCTLTVSFENEPIGHVLSIVCETLGLRYEKTTDGYRISGERCK